MALVFAKSYKLLFQQVSIAPLVILRISLGGLLLYSTLRSWQKGWVSELYIEPAYHFSFLSWVTPVEGSGMYWVFGLMALSSFCILLGAFYRVSTVLFFFLFLYVELLDKTYYLNHYYLITLLTFWLACVPAHRAYSVDVLLFPRIRSLQCARWCILIFQVQLSVVYFFAGLAKVNPDWLLHGQPMATWLPAKYQLPILGSWFHLKETALLFSWLGCLYDLTIWFFLWKKKTRGFAYLAVLAFHILTVILFPRIGMFPAIMIAATLIFFSAKWHQRLLGFLPGDFSWPEKKEVRPSVSPRSQFISYALGIYLLFQLFLPFRYLFYPGNLFWHEQGYRFSWRVMLMEKNGYTQFILRDPKTGRQQEALVDGYLTAFQEQQLRSQPDMILQFARHLGDEFLEQKGYAPEVYVKSRLSLNGRRSQPFTNDTLDVYASDRPMKQNWILPFNP